MATGLRCNMGAPHGAPLRQAGSVRQECAIKQAKQLCVNAGANRSAAEAVAVIVRLG